MSCWHHLDYFTHVYTIGKLEKSQHIAYVSKKLDIFHNVISWLWKSISMNCDFHHRGEILAIQWLQKIVMLFFSKKDSLYQSLSTARWLQRGGLYNQILILIFHALISFAISIGFVHSSEKRVQWWPKLWKPSGSFHYKM